MAPESLSMVPLRYFIRTVSVGGYAIFGATEAHWNSSFVMEVESNSKSDDNSDSASNSTDELVIPDFSTQLMEMSVDYNESESSGREKSSVLIDQLSMLKMQCGDGSKYVLSLVKREK